MLLSTPRGVDTSSVSTTVPEQPVPPWLADQRATAAAASRSLGPSGWVVLQHQLRPEEAVADLDLLLVGPGGVLVVDVVHRSQELRVDVGGLLVGRAHDHGLVRGLRSRTHDVARRLAPVGVPEPTVVGVLAVAGPLAAADQVGDVEVCRTDDLALLARGLRPVLDAAQVRSALDRLSALGHVAPVPRTWRALIPA